MEDWKQKLQSILDDNYTMTATIIILVAVASFGLGRMSVVETAQSNTTTIAPVSRATQPAAAVIAPLVATETEPAPQPAGDFVASRNGTKYHLLTCPGAKQITEANKIYFTSVAEARASGYTPAANCNF